MNQLLRRVKKIESATNNEFSDVLHWISQGLYYDDLTDDQRTLYCKYHGFDRESMETVNLWMNKNDTKKAYHFQLEKRQPPMTPEEERQHIKQVAKEIESFFNSPA